MEMYTFGQMLMAIRIGQSASTPDGRTLKRNSDGLVWIGGREDGKWVEIRDYLFSDLWCISEGDLHPQEMLKREAHERREREMLVNQYEELRGEYLEQRRSRAQQPGRGGQNG